MYHKIARGHAAAFMQDFRNREAFRAYLEGKRFGSLLADFKKSARSKRPGRLIRRLSHNMFRSRHNIYLNHWSKHEKFVTCQCVIFDEKIPISIREDYRVTTFEDDVLQSNDIVLRAGRSGIDGAIRPTASITRHAIQRMLEREACTVEELEAVVLDALTCARHIALAGFDNTYPSATNSYFIPFRGGALVGINTSTQPVIGKISDWDGLSIRTWLSPEMLDSERAARTEALVPMFRKITDSRYQITREDLRDALEASSEPYDFIPKASRNARMPATA